MISKAVSTTAPSTQPPDTEPIICPELSIASFEPTGRGEEPHVVTPFRGSVQYLFCVAHPSARLRPSVYFYDVAKYPTR
jgi:hypothetical protein